MKDAVLILDSENIQYFTGLKGVAGAFLVTSKKDYLITNNAEYLEDAIKPKTTVYDELKKIVKEEKIKVLKVPFGKKSINSYKMASKLGKLVDYTDEINKIRRVKSKDEIRKMKKACKFADEAMEKAVDFIKPGVTERQIRVEILKTLEKTDTVSFKPIVQSGENTMITHSNPTSKKIRKGEMILIDLGFDYEGYCSDMTRTFAIKPTTEQKMLWGTIETAYEIALKKIKKGVYYSDVYKTVEDYFKEIKLINHWNYALGHGIGIRVHEEPLIYKMKKNKIKIENGHTFAIEPGLQLPHIGGCRLENTILFDKKPIELTKYPMEFEL